MKTLSHYRKALLQHGKPAKFVLGRLLVKTHLCTFLTINCGIYRLHFTASVYTLNYWLNPNVCAWPEHAFLLAYLRPGDAVVDVGANQGMMSLTAASAVGPTGAVFAFEPHPLTFARLHHNLKINGAATVSATNVAVGSSEGTVAFADESDDSGNSVTSDGPLTVPVQTLDRLLAGGTQQIAMLKIDVEGYEKFVLEGAAQTLARTDCVYLEADDQMYRTRGYACGEVVAMLHSAGFHVYRWLPGNVLICEVNEAYRTIGLENLLAVRDIQSFMQRSGNRYRLSGVVSPL
jgi:FkbM family methyltransferase